MSNKNHITSDGPLHDIRVLTTNEIINLYGIEIDDDGSVWDPIENWGFNDLRSWAEYYIEVNQDLDNTSRIGKKQHWSDDY
jgi:hypothetical protein